MFIQKYSSYSMSLRLLLVVYIVIVHWLGLPVHTNYS